jgi:hypothetical protein
LADKSKLDYVWKTTSEFVTKHEKLPVNSKKKKECLLFLPS